MSEGLADTLKQLELDVCGGLPQGGGSLWVGLVQDSQQREMVLKLRRSEPEFRLEGDLLAALSECALTPQLIWQSSQALLMERLAAQPLTRRPSRQQLEAAGRALRSFHSAAALLPVSLQQRLVRVGEYAGRVRPGGCLELGCAAADAAHRLGLGLYPAYPLHGDYTVGNLLWDGHEAKVIDPKGMYGPLAWDLAFCVLSSFEPQKSLTPLLKGYGYTPPGLHDCMLVACARYSFYAAKNKCFDQSRALSSAARWLLDTSF